MWNSKIILTLIVSVFFWTSAPTAHSATYYIDFAAGSDSNNGTSKSTPWKRAPGMVAWAGSYSHVAGDQFIFKGGVTWDQSCFPWGIAYAGVSDSVRDYYGVDPTWFTGGSWARPIFDSQGVKKGTVISMQSYVTVDSIEFTGAYWDVADENVRDFWVPWDVDWIIIKNTYHHGWSHAANVDGDEYFGVMGWPTEVGTHNIIDGMVVDGTDTTKHSGGGVFWGAQLIKNSTFKYVVNGAIFGKADVINCEFGPINVVQYAFIHGGDCGPVHSDVIMPIRNGGMTFANNVIHDAEVPCAMTVMPCLGQNNSDYYFNNVLWNVNRPIEIDTRTSSGCGGGSGAKAYVYNNTFFLGDGDSAVAIGTSGNAIGIMDAKNNHYITPSGGSGSKINSSGVITFSETNYVHMSIATATAQGYVAGNAYAPTSPSCSTVDTGAAVSCPGCGSGINSDTSDVSRPQGSAWDIGAYEYVAAGNPTTVTITTNSGANFDTNSATTSLAGTAADDDGISSVTWATDRSESGSCTGTTSWTCSNIPLHNGLNVITVTAHDPGSGTGNDALVATYYEPVSHGSVISVSGPSLVYFSLASIQTCRIAGSVNAPSDSANSFYIDVDADPAGSATKQWHLNLTTGYESQYARWGVFDNPDLYASPKNWPLSTGNHILYIRQRESGTLIQSVTFNTLAPPVNLMAVSVGGAVLR